MQFVHNGIPIHYTVKPRLKHSYISIDEYGDVHLKTPNVSKKFIEHLLDEKTDWILRQKAKNSRKKPVFMEEIEFFGQIHKIENIPELRMILYNMKTKTEQNFQKNLDRFYKEEALHYIPKRVEYYADKMGLKYHKIKFRKMKRRWGSCSKTKELTFNTNLIKRSKEFIDEVVVHELAHLVHFNHSKAFYNLIDRYLEN